MLDRVHALEQENAQLQARAAQLQQVLHQRSEQQLFAVMDCLDALCSMAEAGHPQARALIDRWRAVQQRVEDSSTRLTVVRQNGSR